MSFVKRISNEKQVKRFLETASRYHFKKLQLAALKNKYDLSRTKNRLKGMHLQQMHQKLMQAKTLALEKRYFQTKRKMCAIRAIAEHSPRYAEYFL